MLRTLRLWAFSGFSSFWYHERRFAATLERDTTMLLPHPALGVRAVKQIQTVQRSGLPCALPAGERERALLPCRRNTIWPLMGCAGARGMQPTPSARDPRRG